MLDPNSHKRYRRSLTLNAPESKRQGDVYLDPILSAEALAALGRCTLTPIARDPNKGLILAAGEATGHHHRTTAQTAELFRIDELDDQFVAIMARAGIEVAVGDQIMRSAEPVALVHEEHAAHTLAPAVTYLVTIAEEYVAPQVVRRVAD